MRAGFPLPDTEWKATREFWAGAARGELVIPRCDTCDSFNWYPREQCRSCAQGSFTWTVVSGRGRLFSWSVVRHPFLRQFSDKVPFVPGLVAIDEDPGVRLVTEIVDCDPSELSFDIPVEVVFRDLTFPGVEGRVTAPLFVPARGPARGAR